MASGMKPEWNAKQQERNEIENREICWKTLRRAYEEGRGEFQFLQTFTDWSADFDRYFPADKIYWLQFLIDIVIASS